MQHDYFYEDESQRHAFYRIPKLLITEEQYGRMTTDAKLLYGLFLDRMSLSMMNHWTDDLGRVYVYYTLKAIKRDLHCGQEKAVKLLNELERGGLIERNRQGQGKPSRIYVKTFEVVRKSNFKKFENRTSGNSETELLEIRKSNTNNTNKNKTERNKTDLILSGDGCEESTIDWREVLSDQLEISLMKGRYPPDKEMIDGILELMIEVMTSKKKWIRVSGEDVPTDVVKSRMMKLTSDHLQYVLRCMKENETKVRNIRQYLLAALYNAPVTMDLYYQAAVNHDMANSGMKKGNI